MSLSFEIYKGYVVFTNINDFTVSWTSYENYDSTVSAVAIHMVYILFYFLSRGYLGPGGLANDSDSGNASLCTGGAAAFIDHKVFGIDHIYQSPTCKVSAAQETPT